MFHQFPRNYHVGTCRVRADSRGSRRVPSTRADALGRARDRRRVPRVNRRRSTECRNRRFMWCTAPRRRRTGSGPSGSVCWPRWLANHPTLPASRSLAALASPPRSSPSPSWGAPSSVCSLVGGAPLARLGAIGDTGWARELTPEEVELKERAEREAADATVVAAGNLAGLGETNMPAMGMVKHDLDEVAVKLGSTGECPEAFIRPRVGDKPDWDVSYLASLFLADQIYVICFNCANLRIPEQIAHKTLLVDGKVYDACDQADSIGLDHYKRASLSHGAAISDAMIKRFGKVAVVEDDSTSPVGAHAVRLAPTDLHGFAQAMAREDWSFFRMGWRQFTLEMDPKMECPRECKCDARTSRLCFVSSGVAICAPATRTLSASDIIAGRSISSSAAVLLTTMCSPARPGCSSRSRSSVRRSAWTSTSNTRRR